MLAGAPQPNEIRYYRQVLRLRDNLPCRDRIHLRDHLASPRELLAAADGFILDSFFEGWSLASMEALFTGLPVVLSDVGGAREQIGDDAARGYLVANPLGDPLTMDWESIGSARYRSQVNRDEFVTAMDHLVAGRKDYLSHRDRLAAESAARFSADACLARHAAVLRAVAVGADLLGTDNADAASGAGDPIPIQVPDLKRAPQADARSLSARVRRAALWSVASTLLLKLSGVLLTAVVAHILDPHDFGVFAVASTTYIIVSTIGEVGVSSCLTRADLDIGLLAPTMVTIAVATSVIQAGAMIVFAGPIAAALGSPSAADPIKVMALVVLIVGIFTVPNAQLMRDFEQGRLFLAEVVSFLPYAGVLVVLAKSGNGAMAFAWSRVAGQLISGCVVFVSAPKKYRPGIARSALSILFRFGLPLAAANIINSILVNVDYVLVGHLLGAVALGIYVLAFNAASWPESLLWNVINNVSLPAFSRVKHDADLLKKGIASALRALSLAVMPISALTIALARPVILTLYGAKWEAATAVLSMLSFYGAISIICIFFTNVLAGLGYAKFVLAIQVIWLTALVPAMAVGVHQAGIVGAAIAHIAVIALLVLPSYLLALKRASGVRFVALAKAVLPALLAASAAALAARGVASQFANPLAQLVSGLTAGGLIYIVATAPQAIALFNREQTAKLPVTRILKLYSTAALMLGLRPRYPTRRSLKNTKTKRSVKRDRRNAQRARRARRLWRAEGAMIGRATGGSMPPVARGRARRARPTKRGTVCCSRNSWHVAGGEQL